jgi:tetratricopeptide (TPR) repeat protein
MKIKALAGLFTLVLGLGGAAVQAQADAGVQKNDVEALLEKGLAHEMQGETNLALEAYRMILSIDPASVQANNAISGVYGQLGNYNAQIEWANKALALDTGSAQAYINLGNAYGAMGEFEQAETHMLRAESLDPSSAQAPFVLGLLQLVKGDAEAAIAYYEKAIARDSFFPEAYYSLASLYVDMHQHEKALAPASRLLELFPESEEVQQLHRHIVEHMASHQH